MKEHDQLIVQPDQRDQPLSVNEVIELIYQNECNENTIERYRRDVELALLLDDALDAEET